MACETPLPGMMVILVRGPGAVLATGVFFFIASHAGGRVPPSGIEPKSRSGSCQFHSADCFDVERLGKKVDRRDTCDSVAGPAEDAQIAGERGGIARNVDD